MPKKLFGFSLLMAAVLCIQSISFGFQMLEDIVESLEENLEEGSIMGLGVLYQERPYKGVDEDVYAAPIIILEYERFFIDSSTFGFHIFDEDGMKFSIAGAPRFEGYEADDSNDLNGMQDRDWSFDGGLRFQLKGEYITFTAIALTDLFNEHEGQEFSATVSAELFEGFLTPSVGLRWFSDDLVNYYYGVQGSEEAAGRPAYQPEDTLNFVIGLTIGVPLGESWALVGDIRYEILGDDIEDSPIVDEDGLFRYLIGAVYRF